MTLDRPIARKLVAGLTLLVGLAISIAAFQSVRTWGLSDAKFNFQKATSNRVMAVQRELDADMATLQALAALYQTFSRVSREEFNEFTNRTLEDPTIASLSWVPRVDGAQRNTFVQLARVEGDDDYEIRDSNGNRVEGRDSYFPILYTAATATDADLGLDLGSDEQTLEALRQAEQSGKMVATSRVRLGQTDRGFGFIVYVPIFEKSELHSRILRGFVRGVFDIEALVRESLKYIDEDAAGVRITLLDLLVSDPNEQLLYTDSLDASGSELATEEGFKLIEPLILAERKWQIISESTSAHTTTAAMAYTSLAIGATLTILLAAFLHSLMGRTSEIEKLVEQRTAELAQKATERQEALKLLRRSEERYRDLFETSQALIWTHDEAGLIRTINPAAAVSLGYTPAEMVGESLRTFIIPTERHKFNTYLDTVKSNESSRGLLKLYTKNGATRFWLYHNSRYEDEESTYIRCHALDVTESQQAERELARLNRKNQLILDSAGEGIFGINLAGECSFVNPAALKYTGHSMEELLKADVPVHEMLQPHHPDGRPYPWEESPAFATLQDGSVRRVADEQMWRKDGSWFPVDYVVTPIVEEEDRILGAVVTFQDVTDRKAIEQMKNEFISIVSHELRTPLTSIRGSLGLLASGMLKKFPDRADSMLKIAVENTDRLVRLINDILDIERLESGKVTIDRSKCNLGNLMTQAADTMNAMAGNAKVTLEVTPLEREVYADSDRILQVLTNLLSNAIKFSPEGASIELRAKESDKGVLVQVQDHGRGIPEDKVDKIFERFGQVDASDSREKGGTGLGLPICKTIVQQHGGDLWVESTLGEGSIFQFTIPDVEPEHDEAA
ncbi:MAG: PAS domain S-box protein [Vulcanimicrobiota bacterium]